MKAKFLRNIIFVVGLNLLIKPFWVLGIDRVVQNFLGARVYGIYFTFFNISVLFNIILDIGLTNFNNRFVSQDKFLFYKNFINISFFKLILFLVYLIFTFSFAYFIGYKSRNLLYLLFLLAFNQYLLSMILFIRSNISALQFYWLDSIISALDRLLMIFFVGFFIFSLKLRNFFTINLFILLQTLAYSIVFIFSIIILKIKVRRIIFYLNYKELLRILKEAVPYSLLILLMTLYNRIDAVLLERLLVDGQIQVGIYAQSYRLLDAFNQFSFLFAGLLLPMYSKMLKNNENIEELVNFSFLIIMIPTVIFTITTVFFSETIINLLYKEEVAISFRVFRILFLTTIPVAISYIFGTLLTANWNLKILNLLAASAFVLNLILNLLLIPKYKVFASAAVTLFTQLFMAIMQMYFSVKILKIKIKSQIVKDLFFLIFMTFFINLLGKIFGLSDITWYLGVLMVISLGVLLVKKDYIKKFLFYLTKK